MKQNMIKQFTGQQIIADLYGCDQEMLDNLGQIRQFIHTMCDVIQTEIVEESYHKFQPIGISAYAVITTSHFSIHTWPEFGYAAVDVFSCDGSLTLDICSRMKELLQAERMVTKMLPRRIALEPDTVE